VIVQVLHILFLGENRFEERTILQNIILVIANTKSVLFERLYATRWDDYIFEESLSFFSTKANPMLFTRLIPLPELGYKVDIEGEFAVSDFNHPIEIMHIHNYPFVNGYPVLNFAYGLQFHHIQWAC
jgi:hypothetical protein